MENRTFPSPTLGTPTYRQDEAPAAAGSARAGARSGPLTPPRSLRARRRRPAVIAMAAALIAAGGLGGAVLYDSTGQRIAVLALARDVPYGRALTADDLVVARIASDPALAPVNATDRDLAIGQRATTDLHRGSLLLVADITRALAVQPNQQVVGLAVKPGQLPAGGVQPGQQVIVVLTADQAPGGAPSAGNGPETMGAVVAALGKPGSDGTQVVNVAVPPSDGPKLAAWVAGGKFQVILAARTAASPGSPSGAPSSSGSGSPSGSNSTGSGGSSGGGS